MAKKKPLKSKTEILQGKTPLPDNLTDDTLLKREQAAVYANCSLRTIIIWITDKGLPEVKKGRLSRIRKGDLDRFLKENNDLPTAEPLDESKQRQRIEEAKKDFNRKLWENMGYQDSSHDVCHADFSFDSIYRTMKETESDERKGGP